MTPRVLVPINNVVIQLHQAGVRGAQPFAFCAICEANGFIGSRYGYKFNATGLLDGQLVHKMSCAMNQHAASRLS